MTDTEDRWFLSRVTSGYLKEVYIWPDGTIRVNPYVEPIGYTGIEYLKYAPTSGSYVAKDEGTLYNSGRPVLDINDYGDDVENWNEGEHAND